MDKLLLHLKNSLSSMKPTEVQEIVCDAVQIKEISTESQIEMEKYVNVVTLCFNSCQLKTLNNLPKFPLLEEIQISDNHLTGEEIMKLLVYPHLLMIKICNNLISKIEDLKPLQKLKDISYLDLSECPVTKCENYRKEVFEILPQLQYLDLIDKEGNHYSDLEDDEDEDEEDEEDDEEFIIKDEDANDEGAEDKNAEGEEFEDDEEEEDDNEEGDEAEENESKPSKKQKEN